MHDSHPPGRAPFQPVLDDPFPTPELHQRFAALVQEHFRRRGRTLVLHPDLAAEDDLGGRHGLRNLAQICAGAPPYAWPALVETHLAKSAPEQLELAFAPLQSGEFADVAPSLAVRLHPADPLDPDLDDALVRRTDLPGTATTLVLDGPASVMAVPRPVAELWGVPDAELFDRALANVAAQPGHWKSIVLPQVTTPLDWFAGDFYAASRVLVPGGLRRVGRHGNLVAVPNRGILLSYPIDQLPSLSPLQALLNMAMDMFQDGPGSITPHLYWRTVDGAFHRQQACRDGDRIRLSPSPEFLALWEQLRERPAPG